MNNLEKAIKYFGSKRELANALGVNFMVVHQWTKRQIPLKRAFEIQRVSNGNIKASDLRPDIFDDEQTTAG